MNHHTCSARISSTPSTVLLDSNRVVSPYRAFRVLAMILQRLGLLVPACSLTLRWFGDQARAALAGEIRPKPLVLHAQPILQLRQ